MGKVFLIILFVSLSFSGFAQKKSEIMEVLNRQQENWNKGDIETFMQDYWKSDELKFIGKNGIVKGWQATLDRYLKSYPDRATMGQLKFDIKEVDFLSKKRPGF